jgi:cellulose synthase (UDP-forming)
VRLPTNSQASERLARLFGVYFAAFGAYYIVWRAGWTLNLDALWLALPLLIAETMGYIDFLLFLFMTWSIPPLRVEPAPPGKTVDVFITTYNEDPEVLRSTILGCVHMRYPHKTYVLDDGRRADVKALAESLGATYITRPDNTHAKAGNINHALSLTNGEFVAVFDADHVPHPQFLERTLGRFSDPRVALVQTPQEFYNIDSIQHAGRAPEGAEGRWHEQSLFYRVIQPGKERLNSVFWCGSNAVLRRSAIASIGGIATDTITEDIHTTIRLHRAGWRTAYHNELLATGIAPDDLDAFLTQRKRWAQGAMQVLRSRDNPLWAKGLSLSQRLSYWASMSTYFASFPKLVLIATPLAVLVTGILPMNALGWDFAAHFLPYYLLGLCANTFGARGHGRYLDTERFNLLKSFSFIRASAALIIPRRLQFKVTRKSHLEDRARELRLTLPYVLIMIASAGAIAWAMRQVAVGATSPGLRLALVITSFWALYNAGVVALAVRAVLRRSHRRSAYRFARQVAVQLSPVGEDCPAIRAETNDINPDGFSFTAPSPLAAGSQWHVAIALAGRRTARAVAVVMNSRPTHDGRARMGARFIEMAGDDRNALTLALFGGAGPEESAPEERAA